MFLRIGAARTVLCHWPRGCPPPPPVRRGYYTHTQARPSSGPTGLGFRFFPGLSPGLDTRGGRGAGYSAHCKSASRYLSKTNKWRGSCDNALMNWQSEDQAWLRNRAAKRPERRIVAKQSPHGTWL